MGEQQHVANARLVRKEHNYTVNADTDAARRRHAIFQGSNKVFVIMMSFIITAENLKILSKDGDPARYQIFFRDNYLK